MSTPTPAAEIAAAKRAIQQARRVSVLTGAGISAESGVPTFRSAGGLWRGFRPEQLATADGFFSDPKAVWEWYDWRRSLIAATKPNAAHLALTQLQDRLGKGLALITQNVDGLHERAMTRNVLRLHGSIWRIRCIDCQVESQDNRPTIPDLPPRCPHCGGLMRPAVVWFGENLPGAVWKQAEAAATQAEVFLVVGTSAVVYPAASLIPLASRSRAIVIEINIEETAASHDVQIALRGPAAEFLPHLIGP